jgi:aromatic-L-amino-acid decarboxylase
VSYFQELKMAIVPMNGEMDLDEFRIRGRQLIEWIADYLENPERYPVLSRSKPGEITSQLPTSPPEEPEPMTDILADFEQIILPGITHWNHPGFLAYFGITGSGPSILGELLTASLNVNAMLWRTSPAATELEEVTLNWLGQMIGLPVGFKGVITDTASISSLLAIAAAREATGLEIRQRGLAGRPDLPRLRLYTTDQTHSSIEKAAITLGIGLDGVRRLPVDENFAMDPYELARAVAEDIEDGWRPFCVVATVGTTSTASVDPISLITQTCQLHDLWLHVDGAYGGMAAILPEFQHILEGIEGADSFVVNPHKWLFTSIDCSAFYVQRPDRLKATFSLVPEYLKSEDEGVNNYMDWGVQLGRRFRALKLWMVIRHFGLSGLQTRIREHIRLGQDFAGWIDAEPGFQRLAPAPLSVVCFRACPSDLWEMLSEVSPEEEEKIEEYLEMLNREIIESVNDSGEIFLSATELNGVYSLRVAIGNIRTDESWVLKAQGLLREALLSIDASSRPDSLQFDSLGAEAKDNGA